MQVLGSWQPSRQSMAQSRPLAEDRVLPAPGVATPLPGGSPVSTGGDVPAFLPGSAGYESQSRRPQPPQAPDDARLQSPPPARAPATGGAPPDIPEDPENFKKTQGSAILAWHAPPFGGPPAFGLLLDACLAYSHREAKSNCRA
eukprot:1227456-Amphidinium_carterae.1